MTKTRTQFLLSIFLVTLPFLGFPVNVDMVIVSISGFIIATMTFLSARERRLKVKLQMAIDPVKKSMQTKMKQASQERNKIEEATIAPVNTETNSNPEEKEAPKKRSRLASPILTGTQTGVSS